MSNNRSDMEKQMKKNITRASKGDIEAFEEIYKEFSGLVFNVSLRITNNYEDAMEVSQEVFVSVYRKLSGFRFESSFKTWIYRITVNMAVNHAKKESRQREKILEFQKEPSVNNRASNQEENINKEHREKLLNTMLEELTPEQRGYIVLKHIEGLSCREISDTLNVNINTVKTKLKRARETLMVMRKEVVHDEV